MRPNRPDRGIQSVIVPVPAAESAVGRLRTEGDPWALRGMAAHITIAGHWPIAAVLPPAELRSIARATPGTALLIDRVDVLGDATVPGAPTWAGSGAAGMVAEPFPALAEPAARNHLRRWRHGQPLVRPGCSAG